MTDLMNMQPLTAWDAVLSGHDCEVIGSDGTAIPMDVQRWMCAPDAADHALFVDWCTGPALDVGCGVGRVTQALKGRGIRALGIDISRAAIRLAGERGADAVRQDIFDDVPSEGTWREALLVDGNIGIGGDPVRLLRRLRRLMSSDGSALVEIEGPGTGVVHDTVRLRVQGRLTEAFAWTWVGADAVADVAASAGFQECEIHRFQGRHMARLRRGTVS
ncbi:methyltransferase domain-containing protein [Nesterenkonia sp. F]|uniref:methyltransferase domain-containing protein n=1 Tax=Nesterenkonia sp. F TaxID=795955 RepID=UPI000255CA51|nr:methyltransferase domain-containing protein [Nesterenkonia sp. F]